MGHSEKTLRNTEDAVKRRHNESWSIRIVPDKKVGWFGPSLSSARTSPTLYSSSQVN